MHHDSDRLPAPQVPHPLRVRLPAVNDQGKIPLAAEPDVLDEDPPLDLSWRIVLRVVEARLSHRDDLRVGGQRPEVRHRLRPGAPRLMGMDGHSRVHGGESTGQVDRGAARRDIDADREHVDYAGLPGATDARSEISTKRLATEMQL